MCYFRVGFILFYYGLFCVYKFFENFVQHQFSNFSYLILILKFQFKPPFSLAQTGFGFGKADPEFKFAGVGSTLFGSGSKPKKEEEEGDGGDEEEEAAGEEHDPHFEPIVPLPELIDVKTGEEEEEVRE